MDHQFPASGGRAIPACAGRTPATSRGIACHTGHPRVCGENGMVFARRPAALRGHPRVCGENFPQGPGLRPRFRAIPTCAGRTFLGHPTNASSSGPSPRVRGERVQEDDDDDPNGPSPRVRGEPTSPSGPGSPRPDHPRVCGENYTRNGTTKRYSGPSPRVRGELLVAVPSASAAFGPSPRVRGERICTGRWAGTREDHPRVCGENHNVNSRTAALGRTIPACAGRTLGANDANGLGAEPSPRVRGEHLTNTGVLPVRRWLSLQALP